MMMQSDRALGLATTAFALLLGVAACRTNAPPAAPARHAIVVAANPLAAQAGMRILQAGGSAADAAVAMQAVLGLVEPQSSGIGGGAFITYYDAKTSRCWPTTVARPRRRERLPTCSWQPTAARCRSQPRF